MREGRDALYNKRKTQHTTSDETERTRKDADGRTKRRQLRYG